MGSGSRLKLPLPAGFHLPSAVCRYGFYLLAPNRWDHAAAVLRRPLHTGRDRVEVRIHQRHDLLRIDCHRRLSRDEQTEVRRQVKRMLRLEEDFTEWHRLHPAARRAGFDRLFRSPTIFEDIVKTMTCCNVAWTNTCRMNEQLCERFGEGAFPTPQQLAAQSPNRLKQRTSIGYRAPWVIELARSVDSGQRDLSELADEHVNTMELHARLRAIRGIGPYAAANLLMLLGRYEHLAIDTETVRHCREHLGWPIPTGAAATAGWRRRIERHYTPYAPYPFLAYWFELWMGSSLEVVTS